MDRQVRQALDTLQDAIVWDRANGPAKGRLQRLLSAHGEEWSTLLYHFGPKVAGEFLGIDPYQLDRSLRRRKGEIADG